MDGKPVQPIAQPPCYLLLNKPVRVVSTAYDPEGRTTVLDLVPAKWKARRLYPAGRLDFFSEGLVLLTDDGELTNRVVHPRHHMPRVYHVLIRGGVSDRALDVMRKGMTLAEGEKLAPWKSASCRGRSMICPVFPAMPKPLRGSAAPCSR